MQVEFLGVPRERVGVSSIEVDAATLGQLLSALAARLPPFRDLIKGDRLHPSVAANLNGDRFVSDPRTALRDGDSVLVLSADVGG